MTVKMKTLEQLKSTRIRSKAVSQKKPVKKQWFPTINVGETLCTTLANVFPWPDIRKHVNTNYSSW